METVIDFVQVGKRIRNARNNHDMKQKDLAERLGTNANHLSDIERGKKRASLEMLMQISNILDTPVDDFLKDNPMISSSYMLESDILPILQKFTPESMIVVRDTLENLLRLQDINRNRASEK